jgi:SWI/SNF-related matrix-associated actin-dependent regulator of chromatin subfamily A3
MSQIHVKLNSGNSFQFPGYHVFGLQKSSTQVFLTFPDGTQFALLDTHTAKVLDSIIGIPSVQLEALANLSTLRETIDRATKASDAILRVNINVYGPNKDRKPVGSCLASGKIYLQHPDQQRPGSTYDNPHFLSFPGMQIQSVDLKPQEIGRSALESDDSDQFQKAVSDMYASLKRSSHLKHLVGDTRIRTPLRP